MQTKMLGRAAVAAGLLALIVPSAAFASWWDGGSDGRNDGGYNARRGNRETTTTTAPERAAPGYQQPPGSDTSPGYGPPPDEAPPPQDCCGAPAPPPPPPPIGPIYGCENSTLPDTELALHKATTPPPGTPVQPGDEILVDITWRVTDFVAPDLHKAIDCVYINGAFVPELSGGERPTPNDGHFAFHYVVPLDAPVGGTICDQGFVSGPNGWEDYAREVSNVVCFPIYAPAAPPPPVVETTTTTVPEESQPYTGSERFEQTVAEAPPVPAVLPQTRDVLPRTGGSNGPARLAAAALGLATLLTRGVRRHTRRPPGR